MRKIIVLALALIIAMNSSTAAFGDEPNVIVEAGPDYEILDVTVEQIYDETYGPLESVTITWAPVEPSVDTAAVVVLGASAVFLAAMVCLRRFGRHKSTPMIP